VSKRVADCLNGLPDDAARAALAKCCGARRWVEQMLLARPFAHDAALFEAAERGWWALGREDWLEAFRKHPRIGERTAEQWSRREQAGMDTAAAATRAALARGNLAYSERFRRDARRTATPPRERSGHGAPDRGGRADEDHPAPTRETGGPMTGITTHVLDTARGRPAAGVPVTLAVRSGDRWSELARAATDADGRATLLPDRADAGGTYRLRFEIGEYFAAQRVDAFYPYVEVVFTMRDDHRHHVPLLVSPFGYTTYRGS